MRRSYKLSTIDPHKLALSTATSAMLLVAMHARAVAPAVTLDMTNADPAETQLYQTIKRLALYARDGGKEPTKLARLVEDAQRWCGADATSTTPKDKTPLQLVMAAVEARQALAASKPLSSTQLAMLVDLDRDHINGMAARGEIPSATRLEEVANKPWRFRSNAALRAWIAARNEADRAAEVGAA